MITPDQAQMMAALGVPSGPGMGPAGSTFQSPAASWMSPQFPMVSGGPQIGMDTAALLQGLAPAGQQRGNFMPNPPKV